MDGEAGGPARSVSGVKSLGLERTLVDADAYAHAVERFREQRITLPTFAQLAEPDTIVGAAAEAARASDRGGPDARNLWRVHWHNGSAGAEPVAVPEHVVLPPSLTGVDAPIVALFGNRFPMIGSHKVLAAYACLAPRIVTGQFDPTVHRAVWPSTGNYARGGVAISRIMGCRGIAVLPENMSRARFAWLESWVADPADIIRTPGSESNVKEIYDACDELAADPVNVIFNQFCEFPNHLVHYEATGRALARVFDSLHDADPSLRLRAFVSASGSAGTIAAGDRLKESYGSLTVAVEALECPTLLYNGYGEHNIQGIGDKHVPLIHNVTNNDVVVGVSDRSTDALDVLFNTGEGAAYLADRAGVPASVVGQLRDFGLSSICNVLAAIKLAKHLSLGPEDVIMTVATDGADMYETERVTTLGRFGDGALSDAAAGRIHGEHLLGATDDHLIELTDVDRNRIFNLGYYTWVEQQGVDLADFEARRQQDYWRSLRELVPVWDDMIREFNGQTGV
jgi:cysteine synthase